MEIRPTHEACILDGSATVLGFGTGTDCFDWSLRNLKEAGDEIRPENKELVDRLVSIAWNLQIGSLLMPHPTQMNSEVVSASDLPVVLQRSPSEVRIRRGQYADGVRLRHYIANRHAFAMSAADCALIVVKWRDQIWAAHAGRDSLIDRRLIETDGMERRKKYESVVCSIMAEIPLKFHHEASVYYGCTISPGPHFAHPTDHPYMGAFNEKMLHCLSSTAGKTPLFTSPVEYWLNGQIDMKAIIRRQFESYGVTKFQTDEICTFSNTNPDGSFTWHSNRRDRVKRNLFLVVRN